MAFESVSTKTCNSRTNVSEGMTEGNYTLEGYRKAMRTILFGLKMRNGSFCIIDLVKISSNRLDKNATNVS
jgi:hypothetical protein